MRAISSNPLMYAEYHRGCPPEPLLVSIPMAIRYELRSSGLTAIVSAQGAELVSLKGLAEKSYIWHAGPQWSRHAPILFPIVGRLSGDILRHGDKQYRMTQHGFARDCLFAVVDQDEARITLRLRENADILKMYPFKFELDVTYILIANTFISRTVVKNSGYSELPFGIGAHPGFCWPLVDGQPKEAHSLVFERPELGPVLGIENGLLGDHYPSPFVGRTMRLRPDLFKEGAIVVPSVASSSVRYMMDTQMGSKPWLEICWKNYTDLGLWTSATEASFLCIEPWRGMASPKGWDGQFMEKPGVVILQPGVSDAFEWRVSVFP